MSTSMVCIVSSVSVLGGVASELCCSNSASMVGTPIMFGVWQQVSTSRSTVPKHS